MSRSTYLVVIAKWIVLIQSETFYTFSCIDILSSHFAPVHISGSKTLLLWHFNETKIPRQRDIISQVQVSGDTLKTTIVTLST